MMADMLWVKLMESQALIAGLEAENRTLKVRCQTYLENWTEARRERDELAQKGEGDA